MKEMLLWLFIIDLGIALGGGLHEQRIIHPEWFSGSRTTWSCGRLGGARLPFRLEPRF